MQSVSTRRTIHDISRDEWIVFEWLNVTTYGDPDRYYIRGITRRPEDAEGAGREYDALINALVALS